MLIRSRRRSTRPGVIVGVLMIGALLVVSQLYLTIPLVNDVAERYSLSLSTAAWSGSGFAFAFAAGNLVFPTLSDRLDRRRVMACGLVGLAVSAAVAGASSGFSMLLLSRIVGGLAASAFPPVALAYVSDVLPAQRRPGAFAAISTCFLLAGIVGQSYALAVDGTLGWRWVFWLLIPLLIVCAITLLRLPAPGRTETRLWQTFVHLGRLIRRPALLVAYVAAVTVLLSFVGMYSALSDAASSRYGVEDVGSQVLLRLPGLPGILLGLSTGRLIQRWGAYRCGALAFLVAAGGLALEAAAADFLWVVLLGTAVFTAGLSMTVPCLVTIVGLASGQARGAGLAGYGFLIGIGASAAPLLITSLPEYSFSQICLVLACTLLISAAVLTLGPRAAPSRDHDREVHGDRSDVGHS